MNPHRKRELRRARDLSVIANPVSLSPMSNRLRPPLPSPGLSLYSDRRLWSPYKAIQPAFSFRRYASRLVDRTPVKSKQRAIIAFAVPSKVAVCVRRHRRREVLFAKGVGGGRTRKGRRNMWSDVSC